MAAEIMKIRDNDGNGYDVICYEDLILPTFFKTRSAVVKKLLSIKQIEYKDGDVFLCGYPKCGNHWMSNLITFMQHPGPVQSTMSINIPLVDVFSVRQTKSESSPRLFTTHFKFDRLPHEHIENKGKIILILRNPKDVAVSFFYHLKHPSVKNTQSWERYIQCFMEGRVINGSYFDYLNSWSKLVKSKTYQNILIVYYEDLVKDCFSQLQRIQTFLGLTNSDNRLRQIVERCSIDNLRLDVNRGHLETFLVDEKGESQIYRKGKVGDWKLHFTASQNTEFDKQMKQRVADTSLFKFEYDSHSKKVISKL